LREFIQLACTISTFKRTSNIRNDTWQKLRFIQIRKVWNDKLK
jgi:hypothetical protein